MSGEEETYLRLDKKRRRLYLLLIIPMVLVAIYSISVSLYEFSFDEAMDIIVRHFRGEIKDTYKDFLLDNLIFEGTFPRAVGGVLVGAILAIGGVIMQAIVRNPLADSYTTGISSGALFGVTLYLALDFSLLGHMGNLAVISNALLFSLVPCAIMIVFSVFRKTTPTMMVLVGIATMYVFSAATMLIKYNAENDVIQQIYDWSLGSLAKVTWDNVPYLLISFLIIMIVGLLIAKRIDVLTAGDNCATTMGVNPSLLRIGCLILVSVCTAIAVSFSGTIGFVGLIIPHLSRLIVGTKTSLLIPCSAVMGGLLLIGADSIARVCGSSSLPVGVLTAIIGTPVFLFFLLKTKNSSW